MSIRRVLRASCARHFRGVVFTGVVLVAASTTDSANSATPTGPSNVEDIHVLRSLRESRSTAPGTFCDAGKIGFTAQVEDQYSLKAVATRATDGRVIEARRHDVGALHACLGSAPGVADTNFYAEGVIAGITATGKGKCAITAPEFPEPGITSWRCFLVLSHLSGPYIAGVLTTNTIGSREAMGDRSDPPGYIQPSIATIRLWRKR